MFCLFSSCFDFVFFFFFFFSSRRRHTRSTRDWSSDVCSSDLVVVRRDEGVELLLLLSGGAALLDVDAHGFHPAREVFLTLGGEPFFGEPALELLRAAEFAEDQVQLAHDQLEQLDLLIEQLEDVRSEERRVGKESRSQRAACACRKK